MRRRRGTSYSAGVGKVYGTPTVEPEPQAIDDYSGFKVPLRKLRKDWKGLLTVSPDIRNPQDFVRGIKDDQSLPYARPEPPDEFIAGNILWESDAIMTTELGLALLTEGINPTDTL